MPAILLDLGDGYAIASTDHRPLCARIFPTIEDAEDYAFETGFDLLSYEEED